MKLLHMSIQSIFCISGIWTYFTLINSKNDSNEALKAGDETDNVHSAKKEEETPEFNLDHRYFYSTNFIVFVASLVSSGDSNT